MLAMITALRISYFMVIKIIFFSEKSPDRSEILAYNPEMQQKLIHCLWSDREGSNILYLVPKKYKTAPSKGPHSKHKGEFLCMKSTNLCIHKGCPDSQESNPRRQKSISSYADGTFKDMPLFLCQRPHNCLDTAVV